MHHVVLEKWSRGESGLHRRDPRVKILALLIFLIVVATAQRQLPWEAAGLFLFLAVGLIWAPDTDYSGLRVANVQYFTAVVALVSITGRRQPWSHCYCGDWRWCEYHVSY